MRRIYLLFLFAVAAMGAYAQQTSIVGTVTDSSGAVVKAADVSATQIDGGGHERGAEGEPVGGERARGGGEVPEIGPGQVQDAEEQAGEGQEHDHAEIEQRVTHRQPEAGQDIDSFFHHPIGRWKGTAPSLTANGALASPTLGKGGVAERAPGSRAGMPPDCRCAGDKPAAGEAGQTHPAALLFAWLTGGEPEDVGDVRLELGAGSPGLGLQQLSERGKSLLQIRDPGFLLLHEFRRGHA